MWVTHALHNDTFNPGIDLKRYLECEQRFWLFHSCQIAADYLEEQLYWHLVSFGSYKDKQNLKTNLQ